VTERPRRGKEREGKTESMGGIRWAGEGDHSPVGKTKYQRNGTKGAGTYL